jgi:hypothetical protein
MGQHNIGLRVVMQQINKQKQGAKQMDFYIGQIFEGKYPPAAAVWCNANNAFIDVIGEKRYEIKEVPGPSEEEIKQQRIAELKAELNGTDYKIIKCSECSLAGVDLPYDVAELHAQRQALRDEINELEG